MYTVFEKLKDLPVYGILDDISAHAKSGGICIVNSDTGSGKSLLVPTRIQQDIQKKIFVIQPRRFLAINAAETLSQLSDVTLGEEFGYLIGTSGSGEENKYTDDKTAVAFTTYGYALATKMIMEADNIVLDEIHEQSIDMAICKALIKHRYKNGNPPKNLILMSATLNVEAELAYWQNVAPTKVFSASSGRRFVCEKVHRPAEESAVAAMSLIHEDYKGVLVFAPGAGEIDGIVADLQKLISKESDLKIIVDKIHGQSEYEDRKQALSPPSEGYVKILVGTNVIESGMNLAWVDAGVTTGDKKELHVRPGSGAVVLSKVPLAKTNADQQAGRTNRFRDSKFIICGEKSYDMMASVSSAEIERLPLTALYMHCQAIDIDPNTLEFMPQPKHDKMREAASKLYNLGFFDKNLKFTDDGRFVQNLPVGLETAAMLCHAAKMNVLAEIIPLAACFEMGSLRKDHHFEHGFNNKSDIFDTACAYFVAMKTQKDKTLSREERTEIMQSHNIGMRKYIEASLIITNLEKRFNVRAKYDWYDANNYRRDLKIPLQCLLAASLCHMGTQQLGRRGPQFTPAGTMEVYQTSRSTAVFSSSTNKPAAAKLRTITPKNGSPAFTVAESITLFSVEDLETFSKFRPDVFTKDNVVFGYDSYFVNNVKFLDVMRAEKVLSAPVSRFNQELSTVHIPIEKPSEKGSLGAMLEEAYQKKQRRA